MRGPHYAEFRALFQEKSNRVNQSDYPLVSIRDHHEILNNSPHSMPSQQPFEIVSAHSPDSDDAFMFYGLATKKVRSGFVNFRHVLSDIETLNNKARQGIYELSAISYHAYPYVADKYALMASGSSVGDGYG